MLDCIKNKLIKTRDELIAEKTAEISRQKAVANQTVIIPKLAEYEKEKQNQLSLAQTSYSETVNRINADFAKKGDDFAKITNQAVESKIDEAFKPILALLDKQICDKE